MLTISIRFISKLIGKQASEKGVSDIFGKIGSRMRAYCPYARVVNLRAGRTPLENSGRNASPACRRLSQTFPIYRLFKNL